MICSSKNLLLRIVRLFIGDRLSLRSRAFQGGRSQAANAQTFRIKDYIALGLKKIGLGAGGASHLRDSRLAA